MLMYNEPNDRGDGAFAHQANGQPNGAGGGGRVMRPQAQAQAQGQGQRGGSGFLKKMKFWK
jgi:hypothetical protein